MRGNFLDNHRMALTFDATLKDMARDCPDGFLAEFDRPPTAPIKLLNVDLSTVTRSADLVVGLGDPMEEIVHIEFQTSSAAWKHADVVAYNAILYSQHHVPVHSVVLLLRPEAAHPNMTGHVCYAPRGPNGIMDFRYRVVRVWEIDAERLISGDLGVIPLAVLGRFPEGMSVEESVAATARRVVERLTKEASPDRAGKLLARALLLAGLRVRRNVAFEIFKGVHMMQESDTYLAILEEGEAKGIRKAIMRAGQARFGAPDAAVKSLLDAVTDIERLDRMLDRAVGGGSWHEIVEAR